MCTPLIPLVVQRYNYKAGSQMIYLKSVGMGLLASICGSFIGIAALLAYVQVRYHVRAVGVDLSVIRGGRFLSLLIILFLLGPGLEFLRLNRRLP